MTFSDILVAAALAILAALNSAESQAAPPAGYSLVWADEFHGAAGSPPNPANWTYDLGGGGWGNREQQIYTSSNAVVVADSAATDGWALDIFSSTNGGHSYSSRIKTQGLRAWQYGYIEVRAKVPAGGPACQGYWPAIWTLGPDIVTAGWPACGEIDIMEHLCGKHPKNIYQSLHGNADRQNKSWGQTQTWTNTADFGASYHLFAMLWQRDSITFFIDGVQNGPTLSPSTIGAKNVWQFNKPQFLLINLAIGGAWPGNPSPETVFPAHFRIDYVRVYQATR